MSKKIAGLFFVFIICVTLLLGQAVSVNAQALTPTPTVAPGDPNMATFTQLGRTEIQLIGPYDSATFSFAVPADWKLTKGGKLTLAMGVSFNTNGIAAAANAGIGTITVSLNNVVVAVLPISQVGEVQNEIAIPLEVFTRSTGRTTLRIALDSNYQCTVNSQMGVLIHPTSYFTLPHTTSQADTNLTNFPRPIIQNSITPDSAILVVPDQPSAAELQAAMTIASGLGNLSGNNLVQNITTAGKLTADQQAANHVIYIGKVASLPVLSSLKLPALVSGNQFKIADIAQDDGIIQMINTSVTSSFVTLVVSGTTDLGVVKAAQAISSGVVQPNSVTNLAVVKEVKNTLTPIPQPVDQTLAEMGNVVEVFESRGQTTKNYSFYLQPGNTVSSDAFFELVYGHSALLNYDRSGISVLLNGQPIGSVRFSDVSANKATNRIKIGIPASAIVPGTNRLTINANLVPFDNCAPPNMRGLWVSIQPDSNLHLPLTPVVAKFVTNVDLANYPSPFVYDNMLGTTAFVVAPNDVESWQAAVQISSFLGDTTGSPLTSLAVFYGDKVPDSDRSKYNFIIIGQPTKLPILSEINDKLPVPMQKGTDVAADSNFQVIYKIPPTSPMGYVELMSSPWNSSNIVLSLIGNTQQGVNWATSAILVPAQRSKLAGNFAVVNDQQVITTDTRTVPALPESIATPLPGVVAVPPAQQPAAPVAQNPAWILTLMIASIVMILLILLIVGINSLAKNRKPK